MRIGKFGFLNNFLPYFRLEQELKKEENAMNVVSVSGGEGKSKEGGESKRGEANIEVVEGSPAMLAEMLERGRVDFAPVPSFYYLKNKEKLKTYEFCVASRAERRGEILSVVVVSKRERLGEGAIAVTSQTITSVNLLRIILRERGRVAKNKIVLANGSAAEELLKRCPYALLIGDAALEARRKFNVVMDLGAEWFDLTGYPMVFGISASLSHKNMSEANDKILASLSWGMRNIDEVVAEASKKSGFAADFLKKYFLSLSYRMGVKERKGLELFEEKCVEHHLL
ncbi:MAG: menaquinone biosynthesis protein [Candidatus Methanospirare jalkutatii]|nr:menaquinone biosynthesis protein [Candidatus Methanospirare jalkutatii]